MRWNRQQIGLRHCRINVQVTAHWSVEVHSPSPSPHPLGHEARVRRQVAQGHGAQVQKRLPSASPAGRLASSSQAGIPDPTPLAWLPHWHGVALAAPPGLGHSYPSLPRHERWSPLLFGPNHVLLSS